MQGARRHVALMIAPLFVLALGLFTSVLVPYGYPIKWLATTTPLEDFSPFLVINIGAGILTVSIAFVVAETGLLPAP